MCDLCFRSGDVWKPVAKITILFRNRPLEGYTRLDLHFRSAIIRPWPQRQSVYTVLISLPRKPPRPTLVVRRRRGSRGLDCGETRPATRDSPGRFHFIWVCDRRPWKGNRRTSMA